MYLLYLITAWQALSLLYWEMDYSSVECIVCKLLNSCLVEMKAANGKNVFWFDIWFDIWVASTKESWINNKRERKRKRIWYIIILAQVTVCRRYCSKVKATMIMLWNGKRYLGHLTIVDLTDRIITFISGCFACFKWFFDSNKWFEWFVYFHTY